MEKQKQKQPIIIKLLLSIVIIFGLISFASSITAEFKKSKKDDLRFHNEQCYLPKSGAFSLGVAALVLLTIAQITGNLLVCSKFLPGCITSTTCKVKQPPLAIIFQVFSWISFGVAIILLSTATSISHTQELGEGWVNGECYMVKDGIFIGSAVLVLVTVSSISTSVAIIMRETQVNKAGRFIHN